MRHIQNTVFVLASIIELFFDLNRSKIAHPLMNPNGMVEGNVFGDGLFKSLDCIIAVVR